MAIIGSGVSGASSVHYLNTVFSELDIEVFEKQDHVGGRVHTMEFEGKLKELGAHFIISDNKNMLEIISDYQLNLKDPTKGKSIGIVTDNKL